MAAARPSLADLRQILTARFPTATRPPGRTLLTGVPAVDEAAGGLPLGAVTELVCATRSCGSMLFLSQLLAVTRRSRTRVALVDAADTFDPDSFAAELLTHLVWVRCPPVPNPSSKSSTTLTALHAADLLARDANLGLVVLDLRHAPDAELRRVTGPQWYRFQRAVEPTDLAFVVFTPRPSVPSAQLRLVLETSPTCSVFDRERPALGSALSPVLQRQRLQVSAG